LEKILNKSGKKRLEALFVVFSFFGYDSLTNDPYPNFIRCQKDGYQKELVSGWKRVVSFKL